MTFLNSLSVNLPLTDPILKFLLILVIILFAPIILNKIKIPHLIGLIIAGAVIGTNGFNIIDRDSSIELFGTVGLLYIMFLAGLEIDLGDFKKNSNKSLYFGLLTFIFPLGIGFLGAYYILDYKSLDLYPMEISILFASIIASHTLITYPIISKMGITKNRAVNVAIGGTIITDILALLVLAVIVGLTTSEITNEFWWKLSISVSIFGAFVIFIFPIMGRWFFKTFEDNVLQYIFVLGLVYLAAFLAEISGLEHIIGAFLAGLALNRLIPHTSPLMNKIEFVGNALFIPFFLIGVGMLVDFRVFVNDKETIMVAVVMTLGVIIAKFISAWITQKTFRFSRDERSLIFGLSVAQAAATLAVVLVGHNIVLNQNDIDQALLFGEVVEPIRLLGDSVLNGSILTILVSCTVASFATQKGAKKIVLAEEKESSIGDGSDEVQERILIPINNLEYTGELVNLGVTIKSKKNKSHLYALNILDNTTPEISDRTAQKILNKAAVTAASTDNTLHELLRYDVNIVNGIVNVIKEKKITDLIFGLQAKKGISDKFFNNLTNGILTKCNATTLIYKPVQPFGTIKRHLVIVPVHAEKELGFVSWLSKVWNIARNSGATLHFYGHKDTIKIIKEVQAKHPIECKFEEFSDWEDILILSRDFNVNDNLIIVMSRKDRPSYHSNMNRMPHYLNKYFKDISYILIYPMQAGVSDSSYQTDLKNPAFMEPIELLDDIRKNITKMFKRR